MRGFVVDRLLQLSSFFNSLGVFFKNVALELWRNSKREPIGPLRGNDGAPIVHKHTDIMGDRS